MGDFVGKKTKLLLVSLLMIMFPLMNVKAVCYVNICNDKEEYSRNNLNNYKCRSEEVEEYKCLNVLWEDIQNGVSFIAEIFDINQLYLDLVGEDVPNTSTTSVCGVGGYLWPIGSSTTSEQNGKMFATGDPTSVNITSSFGNDESFRRSTHKGLDIGSSNGAGSDYVIAAQSGTVIYPTSSDRTDYGTGYYGNYSDGGGYGNYVAIQHSDGTVVYYGHLYANSITVTAGDTVERGQVIGKIGSSGSSTGPHLHFEVRVNGEKVNPLNYISVDNPRPDVEGCGNDFSLIETALTKEEFVAKMNNYCERTNNRNFCNNFSANAAEIYDASIANNVNPELVVVTAGTEQSFKSCGTTNNYWGIGISNGKGCSSGPHYSSLTDGIKGYASVLAKYQPGGSMANYITQVYNERLAAGADPNGIGLPGTYVGMQMVYSYLGKHEKGSSGSGGYYYMDPAVAGVTTIYATHEEFLEKCYNAGGEHAHGKEVTAWEQSRYTIYQMEGKNKLRYDIFGI